MNWWMVGCLSNGVIAMAYFGIVVAIVRPLLRSNQLRSNPLGAATAAIFLTCAIHHGSHAVHMLMPAFRIDLVQGLAMRTAWGWQLALWDVLGALVGVYYWSLRRTYSSLMNGAQLFEDFRAREQQALEINDNVLQGLVVARLALEMDEPERAMTSLDTAISSTSEMITGLLGSTERGSTGLLRSTPALADDHPPAPDSEGGAPDGAAPGDETPSGAASPKAPPPETRPPRDARP